MLPFRRDKNKYIIYIMDIQDFKGKSQLLIDFYTKFPHFNYQQFIDDNKLHFKNEKECIQYILDNKEVYTVQESVFLQKHKLINYFNIFLGIVINYGYSDLVKFDKYHIDNLKNNELQNYNDKYTYLLVDSRNINDNISNEYKNKVILYINTDLNDTHIGLIEKYNIQNFILRNSVSKDALLTKITDYKLIFEDNDFDKCFYEIYNYKKKYEQIPEKTNVFRIGSCGTNYLVNNDNLNTHYQIKFEHFCDVDIKINVKCNQNELKLLLNGNEYVENINANILNKFNIHLKNIDKIDIKCLYQVSFISFKYRKENEEIEQLYISPNLYKYKEDNRIHSCHKLSDYKDIYKPCFFYGIAKDEDIDAILNHKGKKYVIFSGGDIDLLYHINKNTSYTNTRWNFLKKLHNLDEIYYIPRSEFMINDMKLLNYKYTYYPFYGDAYSNYYLKPKCTKIYFYTYPDYQKYLYGHSIIEEIKKRKPEYIFLQLTHNKSYFQNKKYCDENNISTCENNYELLQKYQECFIALRLTNHDGIANSVLELGSLGIKTIYNDCKCPAALPYKSIDDIINHIENEKKTIGTIDYSLVENVKKFITPYKEIYYTSFYD